MVWRPIRVLAIYTVALDSNEVIQSESLSYEHMAIGSHSRVEIYALLLDAACKPR